MFSSNLRLMARLLEEVCVKGPKKPIQLWSYDDVTGNFKIVKMLEFFKKEGEMLVRVRYCGLVFLVPCSGDTRSDELVAKALETWNGRLGQTVVDASLTRSGGGRTVPQSSLLLRMEDGTFVPNGVEMSLLLGGNPAQTIGNQVFSLAKAQSQSQDEWITLNVGGCTMHTARSTLVKDSHSMLARMFGDQWPESRTDASGSFMLDLDVKYFAPILNFLRTGSVVIDAGVARDGVLECARFLQVRGVIDFLEAAEKPAPAPPRPYHLMMLACRLASWIGLSGAVPKSVPQKFKFSGTRKYGNQYELFSHSNELVALILNDLARMGWYVVSSSAGGAGADISVYQSYLLANTNSDLIIDELTLPTTLNSAPGNPPAIHGANYPLNAAPGGGPQNAANIM